MLLNELFEDLSDSSLIKIAKDVGQKLYGNDTSGLLFEPKIERLTYSEYVDNGGSEIDTFDYVFFPSSKTGLDAADTKITKKYVDKDGKIYIAGARGVFVLTDPFVKQKKVVHPPDEKIFDEWKKALTKRFPGVAIPKPDKNGAYFPKFNGHLVGQYYSNNESSGIRANSGLVMSVDPNDFSDKNTILINWKVKR